MFVRKEKLRTVKFSLGILLNFRFYEDILPSGRINSYNFKAKLNSV